MQEREATFGSLAAIALEGPRRLQLLAGVAGLSLLALTAALIQQPRNLSSTVAAGPAAIESDVSAASRATDRQATDAAGAPRLHEARGVIHTSLYNAAVKAGLDQPLIMQLVGIFREKIDFRHDVRPGDSFEVVFRQSGDTPAEGDPRILAAEFTNQGHPYQAFWYQDDNGDGDYYTVSGQSVHESILRAPLRYDHISSRFSYHRMNPVLHIVRPHYGVDYAAPMGTPVKAAANGRIKFIGRDGGYGRLVVIESFGKYDTYYAHLHRFAHGLSRGTRVHQGEVIGYVGESGEATGPHLHYGIRVAGHWRDPRTVPLPKARPLPIDQLARFEDRIQPWLAMLDHPADVEIASGEPIDSRDTGSTSLRSAPSRHVMAR